MAGLLAEKRLYHFNGGVFDRTLAGFRPSDRHFRAHLPPQMQYVALTPDMTEGDPFMMAFLPEFSRSIELQELPGWIVFTTDAEQCRVKSARMLGPVNEVPLRGTGVNNRRFRTTAAPSCERRGASEKTTNTPPQSPGKSQ